MRALLWLANKGYDKRYGARPLGRAIQEHIKKPLADEILFGKLRGQKEGKPNFQNCPACER